MNHSLNLQFYLFFISNQLIRGNNYFLWQVRICFGNSHRSSYCFLAAIRSPYSTILDTNSGIVSFFCTVSRLFCSAVGKYINGAGFGSRIHVVIAPIYEFSSVNRYCCEMKNIRSTTHNTYE